MQVDNESAFKEPPATPTRVQEYNSDDGALVGRDGRLTALAVELFIAVFEDQNTLDVCRRFGQGEAFDKAIQLGLRTGLAPPSPVAAYQGPVVRVILLYPCWGCRSSFAAFSSSCVF